MDETAIDLLILSGSRPGLLAETLTGFQARLFRHFRIANVFANVDPFEGTPEDTRACIDLVTGRFPGAEIRSPETPGFTPAVRWLWSSVRAPVAFHLEDDWAIGHDVTPADVFPHLDSATRQVAFLTKEKIWHRASPFHYALKRRKILGLSFGKVIDRDRPVFTTSPSFLEGEFARRCAGMMIPTLDPEKQLYERAGGRNPALGAYTRQYRCRLIGTEGPFWISDTGREHRDRQGVSKRIVAGQSVWSRDS